MATLNLEKKYRSTLRATGFFTSQLKAAIPFSSKLPCGGINGLFDIARAFHTRFFRNARQLTNYFAC